MPFSSGTFSKIYTWATEQLSPPIAVSKLDEQETDFGTALTNCILRDGTGIPTDHTPWNNKKITGLADAAADADALNRQSGDARYLGIAYLSIQQNAQTGNYTLVIADAGKHIYHASGAGAGDTYTIPANSSVAFPVGTTITFANSASDSVSIAITSDTLTLAGTTTTGSRTLAQNGIATALKVTSTSWLISGSGLS